MPRWPPVTYLAREVGTAAAEVFVDEDPFPVCPNWRLAWVRPTASLEVQDLVVPGAAISLGVPHSLGTSLERLDLTQELARRIHDEHDELCGIRYPSSRDGQECLALWERAPALEVVRDGGQVCESSLTDSPTWEEVSQEYARTGQNLEPISPARCSQCLEAAAKRDASTGGLGESLSPAA